MRCRPKGEQDRGHHEQSPTAPARLPDSSKWTAGLGRLAIVAWGSTASSGPRQVHGGRRSADRIPEEAGLRLRERSWYTPRWLGRLLLNITIEPPRDRQAGQRRAPGTG